MLVICARAYKGSRTKPRAACSSVAASLRQSWMCGYKKSHRIISLFRRLSGTATANPARPSNPSPRVAQKLLEQGLVGPTSSGERGRARSPVRGCLLAGRARHRSSPVGHGAFAPRTAASPSLLALEHAGVLHRLAQRHRATAGPGQVPLEVAGPCLGPPDRVRQASLVRHREG